VNSRDARRHLRKVQTPAEARLWAALRRNQLGGLHFRRQENLGKFIADFYCARARLVVEVDGGAHTQSLQMVYDRDREETLELHGYHVIRFTNDEVMHDLDRVLDQIALEVKAQLVSPSSRSGGTGGGGRRP
jgi:very-short-patch-repair endonuclease